jgi:ParB family chromosome partitioning protein
MLDPNLIEIEENVRKSIVLKPAFVKTIKDYGVIQPIVVVAREDGSYGVEKGQRRVLGARKAGVLIPAYVIPAGDNDARRIIEQLIENGQRENLTESDEAAAWKQLAFDMGMSVTEIASHTGSEKKRVEVGIAVAGNETATKAVAEQHLTLDQAAVLIEFEDDPKLVKALRETARKNPDGFAHHAQRLRDQRETERKIASLIEGFTKRGIRVIDWPGWDDKTVAAVEELQDADGKPLTMEGDDSYEGRPGHAVAVQESWRGVEFGHFVTDFKSHGLRKRSTTGAPVGKRTEEEKAERRTLIANNKVWGSAEVVRKEWLTSFLSRRALPKNALSFAASALVQHPAQVAKALNDGNALAQELLGFEYHWGKNPLAALIEQNPGKSTAVILAVTLAALEGHTGKSTWSKPGASDVAYFTALHGWGYTLSDVENLVLGIHPEPEAIDEDTAESADDPAPSDEAVEPGSVEPDFVDVEPSEPEPTQSEQGEQESTGEPEPAESVEQDTDGE